MLWTDLTLSAQDFAPETFQKYGHYKDVLDKDKKPTGERQRKDKPLKTIIGPTIAFNLGIIPVEISISLPIFLTAGAKPAIDGTLTASASLDASKAA